MNTCDPGASPCWVTGKGCKHPTQVRHPYFPYSSVQKSDSIHTNHTCHSEGPWLKTSPSVRVHGDHTKGMAFLNSCQVYICLCPNTFMDEQAKIVWAMSYMKAGQAAKWSAHIFWWEEKPENIGYHKFINWEDFWDEFKREFCPVYADSAAINRLESTAYFQKSCSMDEYPDEFQDLIMEAGYSDPKTIVVKFCQGLDIQIQNAIATMPSGRPSNMVPTDWYTAARTIDQNRATNEAFRSSYQTLSVAPTQTHPSTFNTVRFQALEWSVNHQHAPTPGNPVLMDIDASWKMQPLLFSCYRCGKAGHKAPNCPTQLDIWELSIDDLQTYLEDCLAELDAKQPEPTAEVEEQDFSHHNGWTTFPRCHITIVFLFYLHAPLMKQLNHP